MQCPKNSIDSAATIAALPLCASGYRRSVEMVELELDGARRSPGSASQHGVHSLRGSEQHGAGGGQPPRLLTGDLALLLLGAAAAAPLATAAGAPSVGLQAIAFPAAEMQTHRSPDAPDGYFQARIPAVVLAGNSTLVAMGECARCRPGCKQPVGWSADLCSKRSFDGGRTWPTSTLQIIAVDGSQPDLVYDTRRSTVVLNFCHNRTGDWPLGGKNVQIKSTDNGASWSAPTELPLALGLKAAESGPGIALQLGRQKPPHQVRKKERGL